MHGRYVNRYYLKNTVHQAVNKKILMTIVNIQRLEKAD